MLQFIVRTSLPVSRAESRRSVVKAVLGSLDRWLRRKLLCIFGGQKPVVPIPDFADAYETQRVLEAALLSAKNRCAIKMSEVK